jgi:hypothetical protein
MASGQDNCGGTPAVIFKDMTVAGQCIQQYSIKRTWTATDACNNSSTCLQTIEVSSGCNIDLSLTKTLNAGQGTIAAGDDVVFTITVTNEGLAAVGSLKSSTTSPLSSCWMIRIGQVELRVPGKCHHYTFYRKWSIKRGRINACPKCISSNHTQSQCNIVAGVYTNGAEIDQVFDTNGVDVSAGDVDSVPDEDDTNDPPEKMTMVLL